MAQSLSLLDKCGLLLPHAQSSSFAGASWQIVGRDSQMLIMSMQPGDEVTMEPGAMIFVPEGVESDTSLAGCNALCAGESLFRLRYTNKTAQPQSMGLTPTWPAKIIPVDLTRYRQVMHVLWHL